jgi:outer membrane protein, heavy metal efflux system
MTAPGTWNSPLTETAYTLEMRQKFPWFGERKARGWAAQQEAAAAWHDVDEARLKLSLIAQTAFFDYYLAHRQSELNEQNVSLMRQYRETAQTKYRANQVTQQDVLQADLDLAELDRRSLELRRMARVAKARINTLLLQYPDAPLPPPAQLEVHLTDDDPALLQHLAITQRPDLAALAHQIEVEQAKLTLAYKQFHPDVELFGRYDTFWQPASTQGDLRGQVGVSMNLPVYRHKLHAAVNEAQFRVNQRRAEYEQRITDIRYEVQAAYEQVQESRQVIELYTSKLLPAAEQNVAAARSNYEVNKSTFLDLAQAQRQLVATREQQQEALVTLHRRLAELRNAIGGP